MRPPYSLAPRQGVEPCSKPGFVDQGPDPPAEALLVYSVVWSLVYYVLASCGDYCLLVNTLYLSNVDHFLHSPTGHEPHRTQLCDTGLIKFVRSSIFICRRIHWLAHERWSTSALSSTCEFCFWRPMSDSNRRSPLRQRGVHSWLDWWANLAFCSGEVCSQAFLSSPRDSLYLPHVFSQVLPPPELIHVFSTYIHHSITRQLPFSAICGAAFATPI